MNFGPSSESRRSATGNGAGTSSQGLRKAGKKGAKVKGRDMVVKIFYTLQSPRFGSTMTPAPSAPTPTASTNAASPDFFAVLDPSLSSFSTAASSAPPPPPAVEPSHLAPNYSCFTKLAHPVSVQVIRGTKKNANDGLPDEKAQFGRVTLKTLLSAICISRPELVMDPGKDFSVSAVDAYESWKMGPGQNAASSSAAGAASGSATTSHGVSHDVVEGKGMLSWTMAERKEGTTMVCGRVTGSLDADSRRSKRRKAGDGSVVDHEDDESDSSDEPEETLEIWLQLSERDAFTQGDFLKTLRSYDSPVQKLQSELSELNSSPAKPDRRESAPFTSSSAWQSHSSSSLNSGDPVKRKRSTQDRQSLPVNASTIALPVAPASAFANLPTPATSASSHPVASLPATASSATATRATVENPDLLALFAQLVSSSTTSTAGNSPAPPLDPSQHQQALKNLAKLCGLPVPDDSSLPSPPPPSTQAPTSTSGPLPRPSARPPKSVASSSTSLAESANAARKKPDHFTAIAAAELKGHGKNNPRDPNGCSNCKRKKSTVWREGLNSNGLSISVCNACGTFFNKNGYHRWKGGPEQTGPSSSRPSAPEASTSSARDKPGRALTGRLTATCEADLAKRKVRKRLSNSSPESASRIFGSGIIPPLSPSKHVGPRSPSMSFGFGSSSSRHGSSRAPGIMSSPGRSPRRSNRPGGAGPGAAATSPLRAPADTVTQDGGFDFAALFGGHASPSPRKRTLPGTQGSGGGGTSSEGDGKGMPNYLLTASPGTALNRILNDTSIGSLSSLGEPMQVETTATSTVADSNPFNFFLQQPGSPSQRERKENERPRASTVEPSSAPMDVPGTDADSFESVLSSLRRDFNNRLSSNTLTAPSSPVPSSPCVQPRTSTATPGSKGKAPLSSGRGPPSIYDSFTDRLVTGVVLEADGLDSGRTPHSDSDAWTPPDGASNEDKTLTFDSLLQGDSRDPAPAGGSKGRTEEQSHGYDLAHLLVPNKAGLNSTKRSAFAASRLVPVSDANDFDLGSLPPSSPPQLPSETFPTPSDFDGVTPGTEGGDNDDRDRLSREEQERLTIEAVAEKVASEPNEEARAIIMALLQSGNSGDAAGQSALLEIPGVAGGDKITLDRSTVDKLLSLISNKPSPSATSTSAPTAQSGAVDQASSKSLVGNGDSGTQESPDLSQIDFFNSFASASQAQHDLQHSEQMNGLYSDLFINSQF